MPDFVSEPQRWVIPAVLLVAMAGVVLALAWERWRPSPSTPPSDALAAWALLSTESQEEMDNAALEMGAQAEFDARQDAAEMAQHLADRAQINALYHP